MSGKLVGPGCLAVSNPPLTSSVLKVLAQQRAEQQRRELAQNASSDTPMDPVTFIQTLPSDLRRSVLEDMEDSVLAVMPPDIAAEAQALRREQEARQRQLMHERLFGHSSTSALSAILRSPGMEGRQCMGSGMSNFGHMRLCFCPLYYLDLVHHPASQFQFPSSFLPAFTSRLSGNRGVQYTRLAVQRGGTFQMGGSSSHNRYLCLLSPCHMTYHIYNWAISLGL